MFQHMNCEGYIQLILYIVRGKYVSNPLTPTGLPMYRTGKCCCSFSNWSVPQVPAMVLNVTLRLPYQWPCWKSCLWQCQPNSLRSSHSTPTAVSEQVCQHSQSGYWAGFRWLWVSPSLFELLLFVVCVREGEGGMRDEGVALRNIFVISPIGYKCPPPLDIIKVVLESFCC